MRLMALTRSEVLSGEGMDFLERHSSSWGNQGLALVVGSFEGKTTLYAGCSTILLYPLCDILSGCCFFTGP